MAEISTRQFEIIEAAGKILTQAGVSGLTIKNLAKEMQFSESAIYRHFGSKEEIIIAMLGYLAENMDERLARIPNQTDVEEKFTALFNEQFSYFKKNPHFVVAVFADGLMEESKSINDAILKIMDVKIKHLMPLIKDGQQKGIFNDAVSLDELIHIVMGAFRLQMYKWRIADFKFDIKKSGDKLVRSILALIKTK